jgi:hypothetical protein
LRVFFEQALLGQAATGSARRQHAAVIDRLIAYARSSTRLSETVLESIYFDAYARALGRGATAADTTEWRYWWTRLLREAPRNQQITSHIAIWMDVPRIGVNAALDSLDRTYVRFAPDRRATDKVVDKAMMLLPASDSTRVRLWTERQAAGRTDSAAFVARSLARRAPYRDAAIAELRRLIADTSARVRGARALAVTRTTYERQVRDSRRSLFAALGRALADRGEAAAARDTLRIATATGWDVGLFTQLRRTLLLVGDTAGATEMAARIAVDPTTTDSTRELLARAVVRESPQADWTRLRDAARERMHAHYRERSSQRVMRATGAVRSADGSAVPLQSLFGQRPTVAIFWSRYCGFAIDAVPAIRTLLAALDAAGHPVRFVIAEADSPGLRAELTRLGVTWPVYFDADGAFAKSITAFGTPTFYVIDRSGRIRFNSVNEPLEVLAQIGAIAAEPSSRTTAR